ncbi:MAG TPA: ATP-binding protein [bacterium]|nr:ATP-binding protein [bacterium]
MAETEMNNMNHLNPQQLRNVIDPNEFKFESTQNIESLEDVIGQKRAVEALQLGLDIDDPAYNIFVTGLPSTGKTTIVKRILEQRSKDEPVPDDWLMVNNFEDHYTPKSFSLPPGKGKKFARQMEQLIENLKDEMPETFEDEDYQKKRNKIMEKFQHKKRQKLNELKEEANQHNVNVQKTGAGFQTIPVVDGEPINQEKYQQLSKEKQEEIDRNIDDVKRIIQKKMQAINNLENDLQEEIEELNKKVTLFVVGHRIENLKEEYKQHKEVLEYLDKVKDDIIDNVQGFIQASKNQQEQNDLASMLQGGRNQLDFSRYEVNVLVDNSETCSAPVIVETNPNYINLFGRLEKRAKLGAVYSDFTMVQAGSILKANGGYLVMDIRSVLKNPFVWDTLKRTIRNSEVRIEDIQEQLGYVNVSSIRPQPIPIDVKVILIGEPGIFDLLQKYDEQFEKTFKVRADFDNEADKEEKNVEQYVKFLSKTCREEELSHLAPDGVSAMIEISQREVSDQEKLSLRCGKAVEILIEADYWAGQNGNHLITRQDVIKAYNKKKYRSSLIEEKIQENVLRDIQKIDTEGKKVGQVNALSVFPRGGYLFGRTSRITAETFMGKEGVLNIDRNVEMSGKIHNKGVEILSGWLGKMFAQDIPLTLNISLTFEQSYGKIDGDSASSTEAYSILSALSELAIRQDLAVTGSVNQKGEIQAIGGVNQKIEGFFDICKERGLSGKQGVIIPESNVKNLMLDDRVIDAVEDGKFNIYPVSQISEGIELLTGVNAGQIDENGHYPEESVYGRVKNRLEEYVEKAYALRSKFGEQNGE